MPSVVIDTNPLAYVYNGTPGFGKKYATVLGELAKGNALVVPEIVYGELSLIFASERELDTFLSDTGIVVGQIARTAYVVAAKRWEQYNKRRVLICHRCGKKLPNLRCEQCQSPLKIRQHVLSDFLIGAYALEMEGRRIVTSGAGYYASYFPELDVVTIE